MTTRSTPSDEISCHSFTLNVASRPFDWKDTKQSVYFVYFAFIINRHLSLILKHWIKDVSSAEQSSKEFFFIKSWWSFWTWGPDGRLEGLERCNCYIIFNPSKIQNVSRNWDFILKYQPLLFFVRSAGRDGIEGRIRGIFKKIFTKEV